MKTTKTLKERRTITEEYILNSISSEGYDLELKTNKDKLNFVYDNFKSEKSEDVKRYGEFKAFIEHIGGLPGYFNICYSHYDILKVAKSLGYITLSDKEENKFIEGFFLNIAIAFFRMLKRENK
jgi:hypothetical protein